MAVLTCRPLGRLIFSAGYAHVLLDLPLVAAAIPAASVTVLPLMVLVFP